MSGVAVLASVLSAGTAWEKLFSFLRAFTLVPSSSSWVAMDLEDLRKLERTTRRILATLHDADEHWNIREQSTRLRLRELKELAENIEGVVKEYEREAGRCKMEALKQSARYHFTGKRKRHEADETDSGDTGVVQVPYEFLSRVTKITERFDEIKHFSTHFSLSEDDGERLLTPDTTSLRQTTSFVPEKGILGRDKDVDIIVEKLLSGEGENNGGRHVSVMPIVGMGGLGKTTLAQLVYNDPRVRESFDSHAWVHVSVNFDVNGITRGIISSLTKGRACDFTELSDLQEKLADEMKDKRILLVLDDVHNERGDVWESLCLPMCAARICKIMLTSRSEEVARLVQTMPSHRPSCLSIDESWSLFNQVVFPDQAFDAPANLIEIGKNIVKRCQGLPLAIKTLGSMLRHETDEEKWVDVLENELWHLE